VAENILVGVVVARELAEILISLAGAELDELLPHMVDLKPAN